MKPINTEKNLTDQQLKRQHTITRICAELALELLKNGAESHLVIQWCVRMGKALGLERIECLLTGDGIIITTVDNGHCLTTTRRCHAQGVNYSVVLQIQRLVISVERHGDSPENVYRKFHRIHYKRYHPLFTSFMVALSCACFAKLSGGDAAVMLVTFVAAFVGICVRQFLHKMEFNVFVIFIGSAFFPTLLTTASLKLSWGNDPHYAIASAVLLLVPGVPLLNAFSDILKGHTNMGIGRWVMATEMALGACIGMALAMLVMHINLQEMIYG